MHTTTPAPSQLRDAAFDLENAAHMIETAATLIERADRVTPIGVSGADTRADAAPLRHYAGTLRAAAEREAVSS